MSKEFDGSHGKLYVMPKVSVIIQKGGNIPAGSYSYSYADFVERNRRSVFSIVTSVFTWVIGFCVAVTIFAIPVAITSVVLVNAMSSQGIVTIRTQDVPSDGTRDNRVQDTPRMIVPAAPQP